MADNVNERTFVGGAECKLDCAFCFAKSKDYISSKFPDMASSFSRVGPVLYPVCDSEAQFNTESINALEEIVNASDGPLIVSLSTKSRMSRKIRNKLSRINEILQADRRGFVKLAVSISTFQDADRFEFEFGCSSAEDRVDLLRMAGDLGIVTGLTLKPLLPQISADDYRKLIDLFHSVTDRVLLGGLYCDPDTPFGQKTLKNYAHLVSRRKVSWLPAGPDWLYVEDSKVTRSVKLYAEQVGYRVFESDIHLLRDVSKESIVATSMSFAPAAE